jgi:hypothetical protein
MRHASIAVLATFVIVLLAVPAVAQTTMPPADLAKENAELRAYVDTLESRIAELEAKLKDQQRQEKKSGPRVEIRPFAPAPYGYPLPAPPFRPLTPTPAPKSPDNSLRIMPLPNQSTPDTWRRHEFNGQEFYLIPLR